MWRRIWRNLIKENCCAKRIWLHLSWTRYNAAADVVLFHLLLQGIRNWHCLLFSCKGLSSQLYVREDEKWGTEAPFLVFKELDQLLSWLLCRNIQVISLSQETSAQLSSWEERDLQPVQQFVVWLWETKIVGWGYCQILILEIPFPLFHIMSCQSFNSFWFFYIINAYISRFVGALLTGLRVGWPESNKSEKTTSTHKSEQLSFRQILNKQYVWMLKMRKKGFFLSWFWKGNDIFCSSITVCLRF